MEEQCFLEPFSSFSVGILPEGTAVVGALQLWVHSLICMDQDELAFSSSSF